MKTSIAKNIIENAVATAAAYTDAKSAKASCVFISGEANLLQLEATNLNEAIMLKNVPCVMDELDGKFEKIAVDGKKILSVVKAFKSGDIVFEVKGEELTVSQARSRFKINIMEDNDLAVNFPKGEEKLSINSGLIAGFEKISHAIDPNTTQYMLAGGLISVKNKGIALVGTDTKRLAGVKFDNTNGASPKNVIVPKHAMASIVKLFKGQNIEASLDDVRLTVETEKVLYTTKLVNGKFPDWERIVPQNMKVQTTINTATMLDLVKQAQVVSDEGTIKIGNGELSITAVDDKNESMTAGVEFDESVNGVCFTVNLRFMSDFMLAQNSEDFELHYNDTKMPFVLKCDGTTEVIMPIINAATAASEEEVQEAA